MGLVVNLAYSSFPDCLLIGAGDLDYWLELGVVNYLGVRGINAGCPIYFILDQLPRQCRQS